MLKSISVLYNNISSINADVTNFLCVRVSHVHIDTIITVSILKTVPAMVHHPQPEMDHGPLLLRKAVSTTVC